MWPTPGARGPRAASAAVIVLPPTRIAPALDGAQPGDRLDELALAVAVDAGHARRSRRARTVQRHAVDGGQAAVVDDVRRPSTSSSGSPGVHGAFSTRSTTSRPTIIRASEASSAPAVSIVPTSCRAAAR